MRRIVLPLFLVALPATPLHAAQAEQARLCDQQGRELALRAAEAGLAGQESDARGELAALAEQVCLEYAGLAADAAAARAAAQVADEPEEKDERNAFGFRVIDPQDRVQRGGLKRP